MISPGGRRRSRNGRASIPPLNGSAALGHRNEAGWHEQSCNSKRRADPITASRAAAASMARPATAPGVRIGRMVFRPSASISSEVGSPPHGGVAHLGAQRGARQGGNMRGAAWSGRPHPHGRLSRSRRSARPIGRPRAPPAGRWLRVLTRSAGPGYLAPWPSGRPRVARVLARGLGGRSFRQGGVKGQAPPASPRWV